MKAEIDIPDERETEIAPELSLVPRNCRRKSPDLRPKPLSTNATEVISADRGRLPRHKSPDPTRSTRRLLPEPQASDIGPKHTESPHPKALHAIVSLHESTGDSASVPEPPEHGAQQKQMSTRERSPSRTSTRLPRPKKMKERQTKAETFSVKQFLCSMWELPLPTEFSKSAPSEDLNFAFLENLCSIIEIEIETNNGERFPIFPSKLNRYLIANQEFTPLDWKKESRGLILSAKNPIPNVSRALVPDNELDHEVLFNVSIQDLRFVFGSVKKEPTVVNEDQELPVALSAVLLRVSSDDSD
jgi:hypothetical protein